MKTVWKFNIQPGAAFSLDLPIESKLLSVQTQRDHVCMWVLCDPSETVKESRHFILVGTGEVIANRNYSFIGTFQLEKETLVFHLFEILD